MRQSTRQRVEPGVEGGTTDGKIHADAMAMAMGEKELEKTG
jgi:hypothetical protein